MGPNNGTIPLVDVQDLLLLQRLQDHRGEITSLAFSPDGQFLASAASDGTVRVWGIP